MQNTKIHKTPFWRKNKFDLRQQIEFELAIKRFNLKCLLQILWKKIVGRYYWVTVTNTRTVHKIARLADSVSIKEWREDELPTPAKYKVENLGYPVEVIEEAEGYWGN